VFEGFYINIFFISLQSGQSGGVVLENVDVTIDCIIYDDYKYCNFSLFHSSFLHWYLSPLVKQSSCSHPQVLRGSES